MNHQFGWTIERIHVRILDIPTIRPHKLAFGSIRVQSPVIVQLWLRNGACGFGEAATIGGPSWNEESPESIYHAITRYLAPALVGQFAGGFEAAVERLDRACTGNAFAKSAVEMALLDAVARSLNIPAWQLLGGKVIQSLPLTWTLASGDVEQDLQEAQLRLDQKRHRIFKMKIGANAPADDVAHVTQIARGLQGRATLTVDVNQAWDGNTARRYLTQLVDVGVTLIEQPVARWNVDAACAAGARRARSIRQLAGRCAERAAQPQGGGPPSIGSKAGQGGRLLERDRVAPATGFRCSRRAAGTSCTSTTCSHAGRSTTIELRARSFIPADPACRHGALRCQESLKVPSPPPHHKGDNPWLNSPNPNCSN